MVLTPTERRGALIVVVLLLIGAGWDAWRAHAPRLSRLPDPVPALSAPAPRADSIPVAGPQPMPTRIDLNRATAEELDTLPGIGPVLAGRIVQHRKQHGPFRSVDDLAAVRGIGPRALERLRPRVRVGAL